MFLSALRLRSVLRPLVASIICRAICETTVVFAGPTSGNLAPNPLRTVGEQSGWSRTGRYEEVTHLCQEFATRFPAQVRCQRFGETPEGRPMLALVASQDGTLDPESARARSRPVVLAQGAIHAGEIEGKDAGFWLMRQMLSGQRLPGVLSRVTWVFVPVFNVDGHERFGPYQRPNQNGPVEMGWRVTAQNLNLNRDYVKADAPEMAAMLGLLRSWDPILYIDLHTTDGADFQPDIAVMVQPRQIGAAQLRPLGESLSSRTVAELRQRGHLPTDFYPSFVHTDDPSSGFANDMAPPRFSTGYWPLWNRFAVLVETHSWKPYAHRVRTTADVLETLLSAAAADGARWLQAAQEADRSELQLGGTHLALDFEHGPRATRIRFPGYAYVQEPSAISGTLRTRYDPKRPMNWDVPFYGDVVEHRVVTVPAGGYVVPPAQSELVLAKLREHGLRALRLGKDVRVTDAEVFRVTSHTVHPEPYEGRHPVEVKGAWQPLPPSSSVLAAGSLIVPTAQHGGKLVVNMLEPQGPDSLLAWGFFSVIFEQKEYMEEYVAESVAEQMLSRDAALRTEFLRKLREEPAFARDPQARLNFFYRRHASFDSRQDIYPVLRLSHPLPATDVASVR